MGERKIMNTQAYLRGELVTIVDIDVQGRDVYIAYIDSTGVLKTTKTYAGSSNNSSLAVSGTTDELISTSNLIVQDGLRRNTTYLFRIGSGLNGQIVEYGGFWYEHTNL